jgi:large subunit ribosomal protein L25
MSISFDLQANIREKLGSAESRRIRKSGNIPAVIYDNKGQNQEISVSGKEFEKEYFKGNILATVVNLDINGKKENVIVNKIDLHPVTDRPSHITFVKAGDKVKAKVKIKFSNRDKSPGIKRGGFLNIVNRKVELICPIDQIPAEIEVNISKMIVGDKVKSADITLPENTSFVIKRNFTIASITGRGAKASEESTEAGEGASENEESTEEKKA